MRRPSYKKYLLIGAILFLSISLPACFVGKVREFTFGMLSPLFRGVAFNHTARADLTLLESENHLLRTEIGKLRAVVDQQAKTVSFYQELKSAPLTVARLEEMQFLADTLSQALPASVIYRDPKSWSSSLWVNVGNETNAQLKRTIIQKNSPVVLGRNLVGVIDYVGKKHSRVRLITDASLAPSVRAVRGYQQHKVLAEHISALLRYMTSKSHPSFSSAKTVELKQTLENLKETLLEESGEYYLAKGVVQGAGTPLWRSAHRTLRGIGFNYDFEDKEGSAVVFTTGKPEDGRFNCQPLIQLNDLLVTTGMDGIFPAGLRVGVVTYVSPLREGGYTYELEAAPLIENLDVLQTVFIIPSLEYDQQK